MSHRQTPRSYLRVSMRKNKVRLQIFGESSDIQSSVDHFWILNHSPETAKVISSTLWLFVRCSFTRIKWREMNKWLQNYVNIRNFSFFRVEKDQSNRSRDSVLNHIHHFELSNLESDTKVRKNRPNKNRDGIFSSTFAFLDFRLLKIWLKIRTSRQRIPLHTYFTKTDIYYFRTVCHLWFMNFRC